MSKRLISGTSGLALAASALFAAPAWASPPSNDNRADATRINPPQTVAGTLVDATLEPSQDTSNCGETDASVWYRFTAPKSGAVIVQFDAAGEMDATVDVYRQVRSKLTYINCEATDDRGEATLDESDLKPGDTYMIRVGRQTGSVADSFSMKVLVPSPPPEPPGKPLPSKGAHGSVDRLLNAGDAYRTRMREGVTMRVSLKVSNCARLDIYGPGTQHFGGNSLLSRKCGGFTLFTPDKTGRYYLVVWATKGRSKQKYTLRAARAKQDDTAPGVFIRNTARVKGKVNDGIDNRDLYRFDVTRRSQLKLTTTGDTEMLLMRSSGRRLGRSDYFDRTVSAGRYYVAVEGSGKYTLRRVSRTITRAHVNFNGRHGSTVRPGSSVRLGLRVSPSVNGPGVMVLERLDPVDGWQFVHRYSVRVSGGSAQVGFTPDVGRYRLSGEFKGSRTAAASQAHTAHLKVQGPLVESAAG